MTAAAHPAQRRAALALHALQAGDRAWLLERLEPAQRRAVDGLLAELEALRIPPDRELLQRALAAARPAPSDARARLDALPVERVHALLRDEPAGLVARVLAAHRWRWTQALVARLDAATRRRLAELAREPAFVAGAGDLDAWLIEDLARRGDEPGLVADAPPIVARRGKRRRAR